MTFSSAAYWEERYADGHGSGSGSRGLTADLKARFVNAYIDGHHVDSVVEFGCGDGYQLGLLYAKDYVGIDVSPTVVGLCKRMYRDDLHKEFFTSLKFEEGEFDLALSLDVLYHLVEDSVYDAYLNDLFRAAPSVILYTSDQDLGASNEGMASHMRHRTVAADIARRFPKFGQTMAVKGLDGCWFYVYEWQQ